MPEYGPVLFVDDEGPMRQAVSQWLGLAGLDLIVRDSGADALTLLNDKFPGILVTDLKMQGVDGLKLLQFAKEVDLDLPVVIITGHGDIQTAVECMRLGAYDFIEKPFEPERFLDVIRRASEKRQLIIENRRLRRAVSEQTLSSRILGTSKAAEALRTHVADVANTDVSVILLGETGVGKELVARCIHDFGRRQKGQFVAVNCAAIPETMVESDFLGQQASPVPGPGKVRRPKLEHAIGGTLFLDEIDSMSLSTQAKLLRILQDRVVQQPDNPTTALDIRPVAASKADLRAAGNEGRFRLDLYYRLSVVEMVIPPLRERKEDIPLLFEYFARSAAEAYGRDPPSISGTVLTGIMSHDWPGNVRELRNAAERYALGIGETVAQPTLGETRSLADQVDAFERTIIERSLIENDGRMTSVMESLNIPRRTLSEKMARFGLDRRRYVSPKDQT